MLRETPSDAAGGPFRPLVRSNPARVAVTWIISGLAAGAVVLLGSVLALAFAATLAFALVIATAALTFMAAAGRIGRPRTAAIGPVIEARKVGHSWVAYGWDQRS